MSTMQKLGSVTREQYDMAKQGQPTALSATPLVSARLVLPQSACVMQRVPISE